MKIIVFHRKTIVIAFILGLLTFFIFDATLRIIKNTGNNSYIKAIVINGEYSETNSDTAKGVPNQPIAPSTGGKLAIIIDDFGQSRSGVKEMLKINRHLTFAVMPFLTFSKSDAVNAHEKGYEVIVHLPMEANSGKMSWVGPKPILSSMNDDEIKQIVKDSFSSVPFAIGANIHMGSKAGGDESVISSVLDIIKENGHYFVDSRSCKHPIAKIVADKKGVQCYDRNIFLDGGRTKKQIKEQLRKAENIAIKKGKAIAIGHVGPEGGKITAEAINEMLPEFNSKGIQLVFVSELQSDSCALSLQTNRVSNNMRNPVYLQIEALLLK